MQAVFREYIECLNRRAPDDEVKRLMAGGELQPHERRILPAGFEERESSSDDVNVTVLHQLVDTSSGGHLAAILLLRVTRKDAGQASFEFRRHVFCQFQDTAIADIKIIDDVDALRNREATAVQPPDWTGAPPKAPADKASLGETYRAYFNSVSTRTMDRLPECTHDHIVFNGHRVTREEYRGAMEECHDVMADCKNTLEMLVVDEEIQRLAARVVFEWTPVKKWAGVEPTGKRATFSEHVFVWFDEGRMHTSVTLLDMEAFRRQIQA